MSPKSHARSYLSRLSQLIASTDAGEIDDAVEVIRKAWREGGRSSRWATAAAR